MPEKLDQAVKELDAFQKDHAIEHLEQAVEDLETADPLSVKETSERLAARRADLAAWCRVFQAIDSIKDPKFDPDDSPPVQVMPPPDPDSKFYPPKAVRPEDKKQYDAAVAANRKKRADRQVQFRVRAVEDRAVESAQRVIRRMYTKSAADRGELEGVFAETKLPEPRRQQLTAAPPQQEE